MLFWSVDVVCDVEDAEVTCRREADKREGKGSGALVRLR